MVKKSLFAAAIAICLTVLVVAATSSRVSDAAQSGDKDRVRALLQQKADVNAPQGDGMTALHWAAFQDDVDMAKMLLAGGANVKAVTRLEAITPLLMASKNGSAAMIGVLLDAGADPNVADGNGTTPLMMASASGSVDAVKLLLDRKAQVNAKDAAHGQTALMFAASLNRADAIRVLMDHGADPKIATNVVKPERVRLDEDGNPVKEEKAGPKDEAKGEKAAPKDENAATKDEKAPGKDEKALAKDEKAAPKEEKAKADAPPAEETPELKTLAELRAMAQTLISRLDDLEKQLKSTDAPPRQQREKGASTLGGMTALLFATRDGQMEAARALIEKGADINQAGAGDKTSPLVMAIMNGHYDLAKYLVDRGADPNLADNLGLTALYGTVDVQWEPKSWFPQPVTGQEKTGYLDLMKDLLDHGANPNARLGKKLWFRGMGDRTWVDPAGATALWRATVALDVPAMRLLVAHGADPDIPSKTGETLLMVASGLGWGANFSVNVPDGWMDAVKYCLELGGDVNAKDSRGYTALHGAAYMGNNELIKFLIAKGADVKAVAQDKNTVADMANGPNRYGIPHPETVALLEQLGSANSHNCRSDTCLVAPTDDSKSKNGRGGRGRGVKDAERPAKDAQPAAKGADSEGKAPEPR
jgi:uncharacterized protein